MDPARSDRIHARQAAILLDLYDKTTLAVQAGTPLDTTLSHFYHAHPEFGSRDRRLFSGTLYSAFRWKGWIDRVAPTPEIACVYAHLLDSDKIHPAILKLAGKTGLKAQSLTPMGALSPREKARELSRKTGIEITLSHLVPEWVLPLLGKDGDRLIEAFQTSPPTWLRVRPDSIATVLPLLNELGAEPRSHPRLPGAIAVRRGVNLRALPKAIRPLVDVQDLASQVTGLICNPKAGESWWDACCGSGGKTFHLSSLGGPSLTLLATDIRSTILEELTRRLGDTGNPSIRLSSWDGANQPPPEGSFDGILLDAPCSGTGTWHRNPDARWRTRPEAVQQLITLQGHLLRVCATKLKPGGHLVYATCSLTLDENERRVEQVLKDIPGLAPAPFINPLDLTPCPGLLRIHPWDGPCNGMFIARLRRLR